MKIVEKFIKLYNACPKINEIFCDTLDYNIFKFYEDIVFCNTLDKNILQLIPTGNDRKIKAFQSFFKYNPYCWIIPQKTIDNKIFGFILKSYHQRQYRNLINSQCISSFFGWYNFKNYQKNMPILLVEGVKDCLIIQKHIYPYCLAILTANMSENEYIILKNITNKIILAYDNDDAGNLGKQRDCIKLSENKIQVQIANYIGKDPGDLFNNELGKKILYNEIKNKLQMFTI